MDIPSTMIVMLLWIGSGSGNGGALAIPGFHNMAACRVAAPTVLDFYNIGPRNRISYFHGGRWECVELPRIAEITDESERAEYLRLKQKFEGR